MVRKEYIMDKLKQIKNNSAISTVTLEGLLISDHQCMLPLAKALAAASGRCWEQFRFVDGIELATFYGWQKLREDMMKDYE
jgi:hypothetical protein